MRFSTQILRKTAALAAAFGILSCADATTTPRRELAPAGGARADLAPNTPPLIISQIYGGGGNSGATYTNDFIEIFNPGNTPVSVDGWSVQYASATGTSWQVTTLSGSIPAGGYYLVQQAAGSGGTTPLPTPDASGGIPMSATAGKVVLASQATAFASGTSCPTGATVVDVVSFGNGNCGNPAPTLSNTLAAQRPDGGCTWSGNPLVDFVTAAPAPRNSATAPHVCSAPSAPPASVTIAPDSTGVVVGATTTFTATAKDADGNPVSATFTWTSSDPSIATVDANGVATGVTAGVVTITARTSNDVVGTAKLSIFSSSATPRAGDIVISQVYGGGGNAGSTYRNDFIELFNRTTQPIDVTGWSVQYASASGSFTQATPLSGTLPPGGYYLVQEAAGTGGTVDLPTPDATGSIAMSATAGKILLIQSTTPAGVACPTGATVVDQVSYGSGTNCGTFTPTLSATVAAQRRGGGCVYTADAATDFTTGAPAPRNSATATRSCVVGPLDHVTITGSLSVLAGATTQLVAAALDANDNPVPGAAITWTSGNPSVATVSATGLVTGLVPSAEPVVMTATATADGITKSASVNVMVNGEGINWIDVSSSSTSFPVGFQTQVFATARASQNGPVIPATFTFEAVDPQYMAVENVQGTAIVRGVAVPPDGLRPGLRITATPVGGGTPYTFVSRSITIEAPVSAPTSVYGNNDELGDPTPASPSNPNDFLIRRPQYVLSYNQSRGTPNWVSYELDARQMASGQDRCNCFTADPLLPPDKQILTSDYTNGGYDRGHMTRSADRTLANVDNAVTFYLTNIIPQTADLNQGVWAQFENALADSARAGRAVYIITGPLYSRSRPLTFIKNEGKVAIPDSVWKIALIGPRDGDHPFTRATLDSWDDLEHLTLLAVNMPNVSGVRNDPWSKYLTTVDKIEASTGYDFLSLLQVGFEAALDYKDHGPVARITTSGSGVEGAPVTFDASESSDADFGRTDLGRTEMLSYLWHFSDGSTAVGKTATKSFPGQRTVTATLVVADAFGWPDSATATVTFDRTPAAIVRHAPTLNARIDGSLQMLLGESVTLNGGASITGSLYVPGTPTVRLNGAPHLGTTSDGPGSATPSNYVVTLNGGVSLGTLVRRTDPVAMPTVAAPAAPTGSRTVILNSASDAVGDWSTVRNLIVNGAVGAVSMPEGAYGDVTINGSNKIVLGVEGATTPSVYHFQRLTVNGGGIRVVGPVIVTVGSSVALNGSAGAPAHPEWLTFGVSQGGLTLNGSVSFAGTVIAPNGTVTVNGGSSLTGGLAADRLILNGSGFIRVLSEVR